MKTWAINQSLMYDQFFGQQVTSFDVSTPEGWVHKEFTSYEQAKLFILRCVSAKVARIKFMREWETTSKEKNYAY